MADSVISTKDKELLISIFKNYGDEEGFQRLKLAAIKKYHYDNTNEKNTIVAVLTDKDLLEIVKGLLRQQKEAKDAKFKIWKNESGTFILEGFKEKGDTLDDGYIPNYINDICDEAFFNKCPNGYPENRGIEKLCIPKSVRSIGKNAFRGNYLLTELTFEHGEEDRVSIGEGAFSICDNLKEVTLPPNVSLYTSYRKGYETFRDVRQITCSLFDTFSLGGIAPVVETLIVKCEGELQNKHFSYCKRLKSVSVPYANEIESGTFSECKTLNWVEIPRVKNVGGCAFWDCGNLANMDLSSVEIIGIKAFRGCEKLETVITPMVKNIGEGAFTNCKSIISVDLPDAEIIGRETFKGCDKLEKVYIPKVRTIAEGTFSDCTNLKSVIMSDVVTIKSKAFENCCNLMYMEGIDNLEAIEEEAFEGCSNLATSPMYKKVRENCSTQNVKQDMECLQFSKEVLCEYGRSLQEVNIEIPDGKKIGSVTISCANKYLLTSVYSYDCATVQVVCYNLLKETEQVIVSVAILVY